MNPLALEAKIEAMIHAGYLGDSLGIPVEMKTREEIKNILENTGISGDKIQGFLPPTLHGLYLRERENPLAQTVSSDDTHTSRAFVQSLGETGVLDWDDVTRRLIASFETYPFGYGGSTKSAYKNIKNGENYKNSGVDGWGNGTIMKLGSFSAYLVSHTHLTDADIWKEISTFCSITHTHQSVILGSYIHHKILSFLLLHDSLKDIMPLLQELLYFTEQAEQEDASISLRTMLEKIIGYLEDSSIHSFSDEKILEEFGWGNHPITKFSGRIDITLGICYALFFRNPESNCIFDAISIGGDTDSYGTIIGNMTGALSGTTSQMENLLEQVPEIDIVRAETRKFIKKLSLT